MNNRYRIHIKEMQQSVWIKLTSPCDQDEVDVFQPFHYKSYDTYQEAYRGIEKKNRLVQGPKLISHHSFLILVSPTNHVLTIIKYKIIYLRSLNFSSGSLRKI